MATKTKSTGLIPDADPTSPAGMSAPALAKELIETHGFMRHTALALTHKQRVDEIIKERRARELEAKPGKRDGSSDLDLPAPAEEEEDDFSDLDEMLAELEAEAAKEVVVLPDDGTDWADVSQRPTGHELEADGTDTEGDGNTQPWPGCEKHDLFNCAECSGTAKAHDESLAEPHMFDNQAALARDAESLDLDPDELMAELLAVRDEQEDYVQQHGLLIKDPNTLDYIFDGHAGAGPSASERWMQCTASLGASREFLETLTPNQQEQFAHSNEAARQGTTAHAAAEVEARVVLGGMTQEEADLTMLELSIMPESDGEAYDEEMAEYITEYVDLVKSYAQDRGDENVLIEARVTAVVPLTGLHEGEVYEITGSGDCVALPTPEEPTLVVADLKYGNGIWVDVDENSQARIYGLGALGLLVNEEGALPEWLTDITYHIVQPRMDGIKTRTESISDLLTWRDEVLAPKLTATLYGQNEGATFAPSDTACQFCPARGGCAALAEQRLTMAADLFDVVVEAEFTEGPGAFPETASLTDTRLGELLVQITGLMDIHKDLKAEAERRLYRGDAVPGFQLVNYTPPRKWKDDAATQLADQPVLWNKKLMTPTQALKLAKVHGDELDEALLTSMIDVPDKRPVVAREGDRRKTWEGRPPEAMFPDDVPDESGAA